MKIAITRPRERSEGTVKLVEERGWEALIVPTIEIVAREKEGVMAQVQNLEEYDWLILTSAIGAEIMYNYFGDELKKVKIATIGPKTREVLESYDIYVHLTPEEYRGEALVEALVKEGIKDKKILIARASKGREVLAEELKKKALVTEVSLYDITIPKDKSEIYALVNSLKMGEIDAIIFTSSQSAKNLFKIAGKKIVVGLKDTINCAIGPITARTLRELGVRVDIMPREYTIKACLDELGKHG